MATFEELKTGLETAFDSDGSKGIEATIQINIVRPSIRSTLQMLVDTRLTIGHTNAT